MELTVESGGFGEPFRIQRAHAGLAGSIGPSLKL